MYTKSMQNSIAMANLMSETKHLNAKHLNAP